MIMAEMVCELLVWDGLVSEMNEVEHGGDHMVGWWWFVSWKGEAEGIQEGWSVELCGGVSGWWKR